MLRIFRQKSQPPRSDEELLREYQNSGELEYLGLLYERYAEMVYGVCLKYLKGESQAEDAVMNIFEELVEKVRQHEIRTFKSWLYVVTRNHCLMKLRQDNKNLTVSFEPELMQSVDSRHHIIEIDEGSNEIDELKDCIRQLPAQQKECIEMFYYGDKSYKEIAELTGEDLGKVRSNLQNGRRNLRICMEKKNETKIGK